MQVNSKQLPFLNKSENNFFFLVCAILILFFQISSINKKEKLNFDYFFPNVQIQQNSKNSQFISKEHNNLSLKVYFEKILSTQNNLYNKNSQEILSHVKTNYELYEEERTKIIKNVFN